MIGPCQFPTLGFVVDRHKEIESFHSETYWTIDCCNDFYDDQQQKIKCQFSWQRGHIYDRLVCMILYDLCLSNNGIATVTKVESKPTTRQRPIPMNTIELQKLASIQLHMSSDRTMNIAESLYQRGIISYPRTETDFYLNDFDLNSLIQEQFNHPIWGGYANNLIQQQKFQWPRQGRNNDQGK